jgi:glutamate carboxypeptidase
MVVDAFTSVGASLVATHPQAEQGDHYTLAYGTGTGQIMVSGHFDTVWPLGEAQQRPFKLAQDRATGPGIHDMKAGLLIGLFALKALQHLNLKPRQRLVWLLTSDEEIGSPTSRRLIEAAGRQSNCCLVLEGSHNVSRLTTSRKGVGRYQLTITGRAAHAGVEPEKGISAIEELAHQVQRLHAMTDLGRGTTVNVGVISGGERPNIVAPQARAEIDVRVSSQAEGEAIHKKILTLQPYLSGSRLEIQGAINRWPFEESPAGLALFDRARTIATRLGFTVEKYNSGGGSDGNFVAALGTPTLDGLGSLGGGAHALSEYVIVDSLPQRAALLAELMMNGEF